MPPILEDYSQRYSFRPCPHCGEKPRLLLCEFSDGSHDFVFVCGCGRKAFNEAGSLWAALEKWNHRYDDKYSGTRNCP